MIKWVEQYIRVSFPPSAFLLINAKMPHTLLKIVSAIKTLIIMIFALEWCSSLMFEKTTCYQLCLYFLGQQVTVGNIGGSLNPRCSGEPLFTSSQEKNCHSPHHRSTVQRTLKLRVIKSSTLTHLRLGTEKGQRKFWERRISMICLCSKYVKNCNIFG